MSLRAQRSNLNLSNQSHAIAIPVSLRAQRSNLSLFNQPHADIPFVIPAKAGIYLFLIIVILNLFRI
jgi:hypothetical protein